MDMKNDTMANIQTEAELVGAFVNFMDEQQKAKDEQKILWEDAQKRQRKNLEEADRKLSDLIAANPGVPVRVRLTRGLMNTAYEYGEGALIGSNVCIGRIVRCEMGRSVLHDGTEYFQGEVLNDLRRLEYAVGKDNVESLDWKPCIIAYAGTLGFPNGEDYGELMEL